jgi:HNH endonuclease
MTRQRSCIYCRVTFRSAALTAEPVLPAALGGRLALQRAVCAECAARVRELTDDFLATRFALTAGAMAASRARAGARGAPASPPADASPDDWRRAHRAAAKILYCYLLLELGQAALSSAPSEMLRRHLMDDERTPWSPRWELTPPRHSPSPRWHVMMFDSARSAAAVGLFGTIWFRFPLDLGALAPHGRLVAFDALQGGRGLAVLRSRTGWRYRSAVKWGWQV